MKHYILPLTFCLLASAGITSCKKKSNDNPFGSAKISAVDVVHNGAILHYRIYYGQANNVDSMIVTGDGSAAGHNTYKKFTYGSASINISDETFYTYTLYMNANGSIVKILTSDSTNMIYNGTQIGELNYRVTTMTYPYYQVVTTNYYWQSGDLNQTSSGGTVTTYGYDLAKNGQPGDGLRIDAFLNYGRPIVKTTHLPKELSRSGVWTEQYYYQYDGSGRISQLVKVRNNNGVSADDSSFYNYQYY